MTWWTAPDPAHVHFLDNFSRHLIAQLLGLLWSNTTSSSSSCPFSTSSIIWLAEVTKLLSYACCSYSRQHAVPIVIFPKQHAVDTSVEKKYFFTFWEWERARGGIEPTAAARSQPNCQELVRKKPNRARVCSLPISDLCFRSPRKSFWPLVLQLLLSFFLCFFSLSLSPSRHHLYFSLCLTFPLSLCLPPPPLHSSSSPKLVQDMLWMAKSKKTLSFSTHQHVPNPSFVSAFLPNLFQLIFNFMFYLTSIDLKAVHCVFRFPSFPECADHSADGMTSCFCTPNVWPLGRPNYRYWWGGGPRALNVKTDCRTAKCTFKPVPRTGTWPLPVWKLISLCCLVVYFAGEWPWL